MAGAPAAWLQMALYVALQVAFWGLLLWALYHIIAGLLGPGEVAAVNASRADPRYFRVAAVWMAAILLLGAALFLGGGIGGGMGGMMWTMMGPWMLLPLAFWLVFILAAVSLLRWLAKPGASAGPARPPAETAERGGAAAAAEPGGPSDAGPRSALEILRVRYAKGEISREEFLQMREDILR